MTKSTIDNGEAGSSVRGKLNTMFTELYGDSQIVADFVDGDYRDGAQQNANYAAWLTAVSGSFTRSGSNHRYINSSGYLTNGSADTIRTTHDPLTLRPKGVLIEPSRQNLIKYSSVFTNAVWAFSNTNLTRTDNSATGVDGSATASKLIENSASNVIHRLFSYDASVTTTSGTAYTFSIYLKSNGRNTTIEPVATTGLGSTTVDFDMKLATNGWTMEEHANGVFRVWKSAVATGTGVFYIIMDLIKNGSNTYTGDGSSGVIIEKAQLEVVPAANTPPSSYIDNPSTTQNTRSADSLSFTTNGSTLYFIADDGTYTTATPSAGAYSITPSATKYVLTRMQQSLPADRINAKIVKIKPEQSDIEGLKSAQSPTFAGLVVSTGKMLVGGILSWFRTGAASFQWSTDRTPISSDNRVIAIGYRAGGISGNPTNSTIIANQGGAVATSIANTTIINDTAGGSATSISNSDLIGNEAGNRATAVSSTVAIGASAGAGGSGSLSASVAIGWQSGRFSALTDCVVIGSTAALAPSSATITNSVIIGSTAADNVSGSLTNLILIGYGVESSSASTGNYLNIGNVIKSDLTGTIVEFPGTGIRISTQATPASAGATGVKGDIVHDTNYIYVCTATNTWKRAAIATW